MFNNDRIAITKKGIAGILYRTNAPKMGVEIPIIEYRKKVNKKQNAIKLTDRTGFFTFCNTLII